MPEAKFEPKPGQVDYTNVRFAPVIDCVVRYGDKILLVRRSSELRIYPNLWTGVAGFLDDAKTLRQKVEEELVEEVGVESSHVINLKPGAIFEVEEPEYNKTWIVHPVLVEIDTDQIKLDWESQDYRWLTPIEARTYPIVPSFGKVLDALDLK